MTQVPAVDRCSARSATAGEPMAGTAGHAPGGYLLLEEPAAWAPQPFGGDALALGLVFAGFGAGSLAGAVLGGSLRRPRSFGWLVLALVIGAGLVWGRSAWRRVCRSLRS